MKRILFFVLIGLLISSCAITTTTDFKEDFSGSAKTELNFEKYFDFMSSMIVKKSEDAKGEELEKSNQSMEEMRLKLAEEFSANLNKMEALCKGHDVGDFKLTAENKIITLSYNYNSIYGLNYAYNALEVALAKDEEKPVGDHQYFTVKGSKFIYQDKHIDDKEKGMLMQFDKKGDMMKNITIFNFAKPVKKLKGDVRLSEDKKTVSFESTLGDYMNGKVTEFEIKF
jgi:hypothetical protein